MRRALGRSASIAVAAAALFALPACAPDDAAWIQDCIDGHMCLYRYSDVQYNSNNGANVLSEDNRDSDFGNDFYRSGAVLDNTVTSVYNEMNVTYGALFRLTGYEQGLYCFQPNSAQFNMENYGADNAASSFAGC